MLFLAETMSELRDQVSFEGVAKTYPVEAHVECRYNMKATHRPTTYDWIGVFKVGWASERDFYFYQWVPYPTNRVDGEEFQGSILFQCKSFMLVRIIFSKVLYYLSVLCYHHSLICVDNVLFQR